VIPISNIGSAIAEIKFSFKRRVLPD